jgi:hypothetical protein
MILSLDIEHGIWFLLMTRCCFMWQLFPGPRKTSVLADVLELANKAIVPCLFLTVLSKHLVHNNQNATRFMKKNSKINILLVMYVTIVLPATVAVQIPNRSDHTRLVPSLAMIQLIGIANDASFTGHLCQLNPCGCPTVTVEQNLHAVFQKRPRFTLT